MLMSGRGSNPIQHAGVRVDGTVSWASLAKRADKSARNVFLHVLLTSPRSKRTCEKSRRLPRSSGKQIKGVWDAIKGHAHPSFRRARDCSSPLANRPPSPSTCMSTGRPFPRHPSRGPPPRRLAGARDDVLSSSSSKANCCRPQPRRDWSTAAPLSSPDYRRSITPDALHMLRAEDWGKVVSSAKIIFPFKSRWRELRNGVRKQAAWKAEEAQSRNMAVHRLIRLKKRNILAAAIDGPYA
ncbi:hypothetical protein Bbelb_375490 [Branchiostoma belcheri]|nr:hypothetical protein Bbelb_375490 [Branchiostoma belcheri]